MAVTIQIKRGTEAEILESPIAVGELCLATNSCTLWTYNGVSKCIVGRAVIDTYDNIATYSGTSGRFFYATDQEKLYIHDGATWVQASSSSGSGSAISKIYTQSNHGFSVQQALYRKSDSTWDLAIANDATTAEVLGITQSVTTDTFTLVFAGEITGLSGLVDASTYFLSATVSGLLTPDEPNSFLYFSKPLLVATSSGTGIVNIMRGLKLGEGATVSGGVGDVTLEMLTTTSGDIISQLTTTSGDIVSQIPVTLDAQHINTDTVVYEGDGSLNDSESYATPVMTSNTTPEPFIASVTYAQEGAAWNLFDQADTHWQNGGMLPCDVTFAFDIPRVINKYRIRSRYSYDDWPRTWYIQGSNNSIQWTELDFVATSTHVDPGGIWSEWYTFYNATPYLYYRWHITAGQDKAYVAVMELHYVEAQTAGSGISSYDVLPYADNLHSFLDNIDAEFLKIETTMSGNIVAQIPSLSGYATEEQLATVSGDIVSQIIFPYSLDGGTPYSIYTGIVPIDGGGP